MSALRPFDEAINHCRWKTAVKEAIGYVGDIGEYKGMTFEQVFAAIYNITKGIKGVGLLAAYDISAEICRINGIGINRIYVLGSGTHRACVLLGLKPRTDTIGEATVKSVSRNEVLTAFAKNGHFKESLEAYSCDDLETYICNWQKTRGRRGCGCGL